MGSRGDRVPDRTRSVPTTGSASGAARMSQTRSRLRSDDVDVAVASRHVAPPGRVFVAVLAGDVYGLILGVHLPPCPVAGELLHGDTALLDDQTGPVN